MKDDLALIRTALENINTALVHIALIADELPRLEGWGYATQGRDDWTAEDEKLLLGLALLNGEAT